MKILKMWLPLFMAALLLSAFTATYRLTVTPPAQSGPTLAINGSTTPNQTITGTTMTVTATGGPGQARDYLMICITGGACDGGVYDSVYLNCTQSAPSAPYPVGATCTLNVPTIPSSAYFVKWQNLDSGVVIASLPFAVTGGVTLSALTVSPNSFTAPATFSGTLAVSCSTACPGGASFALSTACTSTDNGLFNPISGVTLSSNGSLTQVRIYNVGVAVTMSGVTNTGACFTVAISGGSLPAITNVSVSPNMFSVPQGGTASFTGALSPVCSPSPCPASATFSLLPGAATASLSANPTSIASGATSVLTWSSTNASSCAGTGFSTANATSGSTNVSPSTTTTYTVTCGTATALATVTVTAPPSSGVCAATGADAQADLAGAGFTTCVIGNDFTQQIPNTAGTGLPQNWLNCALGDTTPAVWYNGFQNYIKTTDALPCVSGSSANSSNSAIYQTTDPTYGNLALLLFEPASHCTNPSGVQNNVVGGGCSNAIQSIPDAPTTAAGSGVWPNNGVYPSAYIEVTARTDNPQNNNTIAMWSAPNPAEQQRVAGPVAGCCWWGYEIDQLINEPGNWSIDGIYWYNQTGAQPDSNINCGNGGGTFQNCIQEYWRQATGSLDTAYHTYGVLSTTDGNNNFSFCAYFDGSRRGCHSRAFLDSNDQNERRWVTWWANSLGSLDSHAYFKSIKIISCASWKSTMCNSSPVGTVVTINGATSATVSAGATFTAAVSNGAANPADAISVCVPNPHTWPDCGGSYSWAYSNGQSSWSVSLIAPTTPGNYIVGYLPGGCVSCMAQTGASAPLTVQ